MAKINCPNCGKEWNTDLFNACECGATLKPDVQQGKEDVKDKEMIQVAMALVRCGWQMALDEVLLWCSERKVTEDFQHGIVDMMDKEKKRQFNWVKLREEMEKMDIGHLMPKTKSNE